MEENLIREKTFAKSKNTFERAKKVMPGGVNSPVRAFRSVGMDPLYIVHGKGNRIWDMDGNEYIDYIGSWGPMILGHGRREILDAVHINVNAGLSFGANTRLEVELAELIVENISHVEMIRMVNSGTEAVMSAIRLARGYTGRSKIIKFEGCYHGHSDSLLVKAGSGAMTFGDPDSAGVTKGAAEDTLLATYNDLKSVERLFEENKDEIACLIVEPVAANMGVVLPKVSFLEGLRELCDKNGTALIFDEVITGFRLAFGGVAQYFGIKPDLVTYGKIIGGGMPVGAYGGRKEIMECVSPLGNVYQAGTLSGNPIAMAAGVETLKILLDNPKIYDHINKMGEFLAEGLRNLGLNVNHVGSLLCPYYTKERVIDYGTAQTADTEKFAKVFRSLIEQGIYTGPSQFEALFVNEAFTKKDIDYTLEAYERALKSL